MQPRRNTMRSAAWWQAWKSLDKYFCQGEHSTVHYYTIQWKEGLCEVETYPYFQRIEDKGWQRCLESIVLDLRIRTRPSISAFTQEGETLTDLVCFDLDHVFRTWCLITNPSLCYMSLLCGQRWYWESERDSTGQNCFGTFIRRSHETTRQAAHRIILVPDASNIIPSRQPAHQIRLVPNIYTLYQQHQSGWKKDERDSLGQMLVFISLLQNDMAQGNLSSDLLPTHGDSSGVCDRKGVQHFCRSTWQTISNSTVGRNAESNYQPFSVPKMLHQIPPISLRGSLFNAWPLYSPQGQNWWI